MLNDPLSISPFVRGRSPVLRYSLTYFSWQAVAAPWTMPLKRDLFLMGLQVVVVPQCLACDDLLEASNAVRGLKPVV